MSDFSETHDIRKFSFDNFWDIYVNSPQKYNYISSPTNKLFDMLQRMNATFNFFGLFLIENCNEDHKLSIVDT